MNNLETALLAAAENTAEPVGPPISIGIPDHATIKLADDTGSHLLDGAVISHWTHDA